MAIRQLANLDFEGVARIQNLPDAVSAQEPATKAQLDAAVLGLGFKDNVRVKTQSNINLASPGATIDGITMAADDRVLVGSQSAQTENGITDGAQRYAVWMLSWALFKAMCADRLSLVDPEVDQRRGELAKLVGIRREFDIFGHLRQNHRRSIDKFRAEAKSA